MPSDSNQTNAILTTGVIGATTIGDSSAFFPTLQITPLSDEMLKILSVRIYNDDAGAIVARYQTQTVAAAAAGASAAGVPQNCILHKGKNAISDINKQKCRIFLNTLPTNGSRIALDGVTSTSNSFEFDTDGTSDGGGVYYIYTPTYATVPAAAAQFCAKVNALYSTTLIRAGVVDSQRGIIDVYDDAFLAASSQTPMSSKTGGDSSTSITLVEKLRVVNFTNKGASPVNPTLKHATPKHLGVMRIATKATVEEAIDAYDSHGIEVNGRDGESFGISFDSAVVADIRVRMRRVELRP